jgi:DnaJ family protein B protein 12
MEEKNERKEKSEILFKKAMDFYTKQEYEEALKYFKASINFYSNDRADLFIKVCENNIPQNNTKSKSNHQKSYSSSFPNLYTKNSNNHNNSYSHQTSFSSQNASNIDNSQSNQDNNKNNSDDLKCKELLKKKDYYNLLNIKKDATAEEIKRAYKKQAIQFHPDKNHSKMAEECFKKISEAYQCLSDPEKKNFYDKYGNEEEYRQRYYQAHHHDEEEMDPYDIFEILFGIPNLQGRGRRRENRNFRRHYAHNIQFNDFGGINIRGNSLLFLFVPFLLMIVIQILPELFSLFKPAPLYQFTRNSNYRFNKRTSKNNINFYVNDKFLKKYPHQEDYLSIEYQIEKEYLNHLYNNCMKVVSKKKDLEYYMKYSYSKYERFAYQQQINKLNFEDCQQYNKLKNRINYY